MTDQLYKRSLLDVAIRILAVYQLITACVDVAAYLSLSENVQATLRGSPSAQIPYVVVRLFAGLILFLGAPAIVRFAYRKDQPESLKTEVVEQPAKHLPE